MNADVKQLRANEISSRVIECAFRVSNVLGTGFLEKVYENALAVELRHSGMEFAQQHLRVTNLSLGLLLNFGNPRVDVKRIVWKF